MPDKDKKHILTNLEAMTDAYERIRTKTKGHVDFSDMNQPGYVNVSDTSLIANLITADGRDYLIRITRLDKK